MSVFRTDFPLGLVAIFAPTDNALHFARQSMSNADVPFFYELLLDVKVSEGRKFKFTKIIPHLKRIFYHFKIVNFYLRYKVVQEL